MNPSTEVDLDKARDEKCVPIAREILAKMVDHLLPQQPDSVNQYDVIILDVLKRMLDNDVNIAMEAQYLFQLILGAFSGMSAIVHSLDLAPVDDPRYLAIGRKMLAILSESNVRLTNVTPEEMQKDFADAKVKFQELFTAEKLTRLELQYIMDSIFESVKVTNNKVSEGLEQSVRKAEAKIFGVEDLTELTVKKINDILVNNVSVIYSKPVPVVPPEGEVTPPAGDGQALPPEPLPEDVAPSEDQQ